MSITEIKVVKNNNLLDILEAKASNLFPQVMPEMVKKVWKADFQPVKQWQNSTISVAIEGDYGDN